MAKVAKGTGRDKPGSVFLLTDPVRLPDPLAAVGSLPRGVTVILRHYESPDRPALARRLADACRRRRIALVVAGDARLAVAVGAAGLHLPEGLLRRAPRRWWLWRKPGWTVTAAAHGRAAIARAAGAGVDAVLLSPVFPTPSHPGARVLGPVRFRLLRQGSAVRVVALGGVAPGNARRLGGGAVAGIGAVLALVGVRRRESG